MKSVFADTSFYIASINPRDALYETALTATDACAGRFITTEYVLVELGFPNVAGSPRYCSTSRFAHESGSRPAF